MKTFISFIFLIFIFYEIDKVFSEEYLNCQITEELENDKPAKKNSMNSINLFYFLI